MIGLPSAPLAVPFFVWRSGFLDQNSSPQWIGTACIGRTAMTNTRIQDLGEHLVLSWCWNRVVVAELDLTAEFAD